MDARQLGGLLLVLLFSGAVLVSFALLDRRPPNDHDDFFTEESIPFVAEFSDASLAQRPGVLFRHFSDGGLHPPLARTTLVASLGSFGPSRALFRATNLPFLLLFGLGTWLLGRALGLGRWSLLAAFVVLSLPLVIHGSRKWFLHFHAASLSPLGLCLALWALSARDRKGLRIWAALGLWQALRLYTHPIVLVDVAGTLGLTSAFALFLAHRRGTGLRRSALGVGLCLLCFGLAAAWVLGLGRGTLGEPSYSLSNYLDSRARVADASWWAAEAGATQVGLLLSLLRETVWNHVGPAFALLLIPGLALLPAALRPRLSERPEISDLASRRALVTLLCLATLPVVLLTTSNQTFLGDWLYLAAPLGVLSLVGLRSWIGRLERGQRLAEPALVVAFVAVGLATSLGPLSLDLELGEPTARVAPGTSAVTDLLLRSSSGGPTSTHHIPIRRAGATERLAESLRARAPGPGPAQLGVADLLWRPRDEGGGDCRLSDPEDPTRWSWGLDDPKWAGDLSAWPFVFAGFEGLETQALGPGPDWSSSPRQVLVRLWLVPEAGSCVARDRLPDGLVAGARAFAEQALGWGARPASSEFLPDPEGWLAGWTLEWEFSRAYLRAGLLVDRGLRGDVPSGEERPRAPVEAGGAPAPP